MKSGEKIYKLKDNRDIMLRDIKVSDAAELLKFVKKVTAESDYLLTASDEINRSVEDEMLWISKYDELENDLLIGAYYGNLQIGMLNFNAKYRRRAKHTGIFGMSVDSKFRGLGVGNSLLEALLSWSAVKYDLIKITLEVVEDNIPAVELYKKFGFQTEGKKLKDMRLDNGKYVNVLCMYKFIK